MTDFDLRNVLADRAYPTASIKVHMTEEPYFELAALDRAVASAGTDAARAKATKAFEAARAALADAAYTVHLRGTSPRAREDLQSEALHEFPIRRDIYGRDNDEVARNRGKLLSELYFAAHITKVVWPGGVGEQVWDEESERDLARAFLGQAPDFAIETVDAAIGALRAKAEADRYGKQDIDFL